MTVSKELATTEFSATPDIILVDGMEALPEQDRLALVMHLYQIRQSDHALRTALTTTCLSMWKIKKILDPKDDAEATLRKFFQSNIPHVDVRTGYRYAEIGKALELHMSLGMEEAKLARLTQRALLVLSSKNMDPEVAQAALQVKGGDTTTIDSTAFKKMIADESLPEIQKLSDALKEKEREAAATKAELESVMQSRANIQRQLQASETDLLSAQEFNKQLHTQMSEQTRPPRPVVEVVAAPASLTKADEQRVKELREVQERLNDEVARLQDAKERMRDQLAQAEKKTKQISEELSITEDVVQALNRAEADFAKLTMNSGSGSIAKIIAADPRAIQRIEKFANGVYEYAEAIKAAIQNKNKAA
jgi:myosin heavy subunit